jgi:CRP-like cAMP-binding protein
LNGGKAELEQLFQEGHERVVPRGGMLAEAGQPVSWIFKINDGWAGRIATWADGRRCICGFYLPGDVIGLRKILSVSPDIDVEALTAMTVVAIPISAMDRLLSSAAFASYVIWLLGQELSEADRAHSLAGLSAQEKIAALMVRFHARLRARNMAGPTSFHMPLTQEQIADHLGLTTVHVNRVVRHLSQENIIRLDRPLAEIFDSKRLQLLAEGDPIRWRELGISEQLDPNNRKRSAES